MEDHDAYLNSVDPNPYWIVASTMQYRPDGVPHPLDVRELKVLSHEVIEGSDEQVLVTIEIKA
ncbi:hypothetical protein [Rhizobium leguminosarum]|uniref:hypothetical protein n=1 Tax=Rhizobium leguminosarum TaxID=384 RepID=UPI0015DA7041|nr:hypothetical protein [Rhizobium leguminosarum]NZD54159.1 hypothetical protein [Rhizobium leguminosarum]